MEEVDLSFLNLLKTVLLILELQLVTGYFSVGFFGVGVNPTAEGSRILKAVSDQVSRRVEAFVSGMIVENDDTLFVLVAEDFLEKFIAEQFGMGQGNRFVLLAGPEVKKTRGRFGVERSLQIERLDEDLFVVLMGGKNVADNFVDGQVFISLTDFGEGFIIIIAAALAAADVILGEERAFSAGEAFEDFTHRDFAVDEVLFCRGGHREGIWTGKTALKFEI